MIRIFSNLAISLDGKIADPATPARSLGSAVDKKLMQSLRAKANVVVMGAQTLRVFKKFVRPQKLSSTYANAIITRSGNLDSEMPFWNETQGIRFVFTTKKGEAAALRAARDRAFVVVAGEDTVDPMIVIKRLKQSNFDQILIEGGGETVGLFLRAGLLQEMYITLSPWIIGNSKAPGLVGGDKALWSKMTLKKCTKKGSELFLHYQVRKDK
jgi:riboflavin biosynthesis pyrimidine reductase